MNRAAAYLLVFVAAGTPWIEVLVVVPAALLAGLAPVAVVALAAAGNIATLVPVVLAGERMVRWWRRRRGRPPGRDSRREARGQRLLDRYGLPGLALLAPLLTGVHIAALAAVGAGARRRPTLLWMSAGVTAWAIAMAIATVVGIDALIDPDGLPDLFQQARGLVIGDSDVPLPK